MKRNCNLDLRQFPPAVSKFSDDDNHCPPMEISEQGRSSQLHTIIFDGIVNVCDVTELQARAIILHASQGMEYKSNSPPILASQMCTSPGGTGTSMKRSLQTFLLKRKHRVQATSSPY